MSGFVSNLLSGVNCFHLECLLIFLSDFPPEKFVTFELFIKTILPNVSSVKMLQIVLTHTHTKRFVVKYLTVSQQLLSTGPQQTAGEAAGT